MMIDGPSSDLIYLMMIDGQLSGLIYMMMIYGLGRFNKTIDFCFRNIHDAFQSLCRLPLGHSDHDIIHLVPKYRQKLTREIPRTHCVRVWDHDSPEALRGCFKCTDWQVFFDGCSDNSDELIDTVTSYIHWC